MIGTIIKIENNLIYLNPSINIYEYGNMINKHVVFEGNQKLIGEIININEYMEIKIIGEIINNSFIYSDINKPSFNSKCRLINKEDLDIIFSSNTPDNIKIGTSVLYKNYNINLAINPFFSNHFAILGNTGSGKSYSVARIIQSIYEDSNKIPFRSNIFLFDAYGEYQQAFTNIGNNNW